MQDKRFDPTPSGRARTVRFAALVCVLAVGVSALAYMKQARQPEPLSTAENPQVVEQPEKDDVISPAQRNAPRSVDAVSVPDESDESAEPESAPETPEQKAAFTIAMPVEGDLVQLYAMDHLSYDPTTRDWRTHDGVDIRAAAGMEVRAAADGTVAAVEHGDTLGTVITIRHPGGYLTRYGNLDEACAVQEGQEVAQGDVIGTVGASALMEAGQESHLHFALCAGDTSLNPVDYFAW